MSLFCVSENFDADTPVLSQSVTVDLTRVSSGVLQERIQRQGLAFCPCQSFQKLDPFARLSSASCISAALPSICAMSMSFSFVPPCT